MFTFTRKHFVKVNIDGSVLKKYTHWDKLSCLSVYIFLSFWGNQRRQKPNFPHLRHIKIIGSFKTQLHQKKNCCEKIFIIKMQFWVGCPCFNFSYYVNYLLLFATLLTFLEAKSFCYGLFLLHFFLIKAVRGLHTSLKDNCKTSLQFLIKGVYDMLMAYKIFSQHGPSKM